MIFPCVSLAGNSAFKVVGSSGVERFNIQDSGLIGIGTSSPSVNLHIVASTSYSGFSGFRVDETNVYVKPNIRIGNLMASDGTYSLSGIWMTATTTFTPSFTNYSFLYVQNSGSIFNSGSTESLFFRIGNATKMLINSSGNVGIGTTSVAQKLVVGGNVLADSYLDYSDVYTGDALSVIRNVRGVSSSKGEWKEVDHYSLPES